MDTPSILNAKTYLDFDGLAQLKGQARQNSAKALRETAQQFEAMFLQEMLKSMRQTIDKSELTSNAHTETFEHMFDKEVAMKMAQRGGTGLADMLVATLSKQQAQAAQTLEMMQNAATQTTDKAFPLNPRAQGLPLNENAAPKGLPWRESGVLPLNLPPKPLGNEP